jgi:hypothetical protein
MSVTEITEYFVTAMSNAQAISLNGIKIGQYSSFTSVCQDGYSLSNTPVPGFDNSEVLAKVNECQPLTSTSGSYQNEILKSVFNIGLKRTEAKPLWIIPNSIRQRRFTGQGKNRKEVTVPAGDSVDATLHRQFALLAGKDTKHKLNFANKYGLLRRHTVHNLIFRNSDTGHQVHIGESLLWWQEEIVDLASCLKLWDLIWSENKAINDIILWHRDGISIRLGNEDVQLVNRANMNLLDKWGRGDTKGPALYFLSLEMNKRLANALTPKISASGEHDVYFYPDSLLSAIWLMFLLEVSGSSRLLRCEICGDYFNTDDPRAQFCSARCRMRNYRRRKSKNK